MGVADSLKEDFKAEITRDVAIFFGETALVETLLPAKQATQEAAQVNEAVQTIDPARLEQMKNDLANQLFGRNLTETKEEQVRPVMAKPRVVREEQVVKKTVAVIDESDDDLSASIAKLLS